MDINYNVEKSVLSEQIAKRLEKMIMSDSTQVSQKLPSEQALAEGFCVSRPVVREALTILKAKGLVNQKQGGGSYISLPDVRQMGECVNRMVTMHNINFEEVYVARVTLEVTTARLAAERATEEEIASLRALNERMIASESNLVLHAQLDLQFHIQLADIANNHILSMFLQSLYFMIDKMIGSVLSLTGAPEDGYRFHSRIIDHLQNGDSIAIQEVMRQHLMLSMRNFEMAIADRSKQSVRSS